MDEKYSTARRGLTYEHINETRTKGCWLSEQLTALSASIDQQRFSYVTLLQGHMRRLPSITVS